MGTKPIRTYVRTFGIAMILYAAMLTGAVLLLPYVGGSPWRYLLVLLPVVPVVFGLRAMLRFVEQMDELQRRIQLAGLAFACALVAMLTFAYGFLELAGFPRLSWIWILPLTLMLWGLGTALASRRYQ